MISKEERNMLNQELILVDLYERYMRTLFGHKTKLEELVHQEEEPQKKKKLREALENYEAVIVKALSEVAKELYHFNFAREVIKFLLRFSFRKNEKVQEAIADFLHFFMTSPNPSIYQFKLLILEHFSKLLKQRKFAMSLPEIVFCGLVQIYVEDSSAISKEDKQVDALDKRIADLKEKQQRGKLSKAGVKMLKEAEKERSRRNEKRKKKGLDDPRLRKELKAELKQSEAVVDPKKINKLVD